VVWLVSADCRGDRRRRRPRHGGANGVAVAEKDLGGVVQFVCLAEVHDLAVVGAGGEHGHWWRVVWLEAAAAVLRRGSAAVVWMVVFERDAWVGERGGRRWYFEGRPGTQSCNQGGSNNSRTQAHGRSAT